MAAILERKTAQSLQGVCVIAKSPLLRIHGNALFLIEVNDGLSSGPNKFLLARGDDATSQVYDSIVVGSCYNVENVIPTTVTKGTDRPRKILLLSAYSKITSCFKDGIPIDLNISVCEGTVTKCIDKTLGIYELSGNQRLYLTYQYDGKSHLTSIPLGSKVTIHNAHRICTADRESEVLSQRESIICCMRTSLKIEDNLEEIPSIKEKSGNMQRILLPLCAKMYPSLTVLEWLRLQAIPSLLHKLVPDILKLKEMLPVLIKLLTTKMTSSDLPIISERKRNPYEDFLSHDQSCHLSQPSKDISKQTVPCTFPDVSELATYLDSPSDNPINHITSLKQPGWTCSVLRSCDLPIPMVLVAKLCCHESDGKLYLKDTTGSIPCALAQILPLKKPLKSCHKSNEGGKPEIFDSEPKCSTYSFDPHPCLDYLLRIDDFILIQEKPCCMDFSEISKETVESDADAKMSGSKFFVIFDPRNTLCLYGQPETTVSPGSQRLRGRKRSSASSPSESIISTTFLLRSRRQLLRHQDGGQGMAGSAMPSFYCDILLLEPSHTKVATKDVVLKHESVLPGEKNDEERVGRRVHLKQAKRDAVPRPRPDRDGENNRNECSERQGHPKQSKKDAVPAHSGNSIGGRDEDDKACRQEERMEAGTVALLCFRGDAIRWYNFLREGQIYRMECKEKDMQAHVLPSIMRLSKKGMTQPVYIITSFSQLHALQDSPGENCHRQTNKLLSTESCQSSKGKQRHHDNAYISISGVVTRKICRDSSYQEAHSSRRETCVPSIHLDIRDISTQTTYSVFLPSDLHHNTTGLVPGATVSLRNCLMKTDPGLEIIYEVGPVTSIYVERFSTDSFCEIATKPDVLPGSNQTSDTKSQATMKQRSFLYHIIQDPTRDPTKFSWVYAHVSVITKLVLRWICMHCGRNDCKCPNTTTQHGKLITQILFAVDDGTGECLIWSNRPNVVSVILGLSPRHSTLMEDCCTGPNKELVYHKWAKGRTEEYAWEAASGSGPRRSRLTLAVSKLCQHSSIQRSFWFKTRRFRESTNNKDESSESNKSAWPTGLVLCCDEVCS